MTPDRVGQKAREKRERDKKARLQQQRMRRIRIMATVAGVVAIGLVLFFAFKGKSTTTPTAAQSSSSAEASQSPLPAGDAGTPHKCAPSGPGSNKMCYSQFPANKKINPKLVYTADIQTSMGTIVVALDAVHAPKTVESFIFLGYNQFFDGLTFHRVIPGFMIQGGDPLGSGQGGPGYQFEDENTVNGFGQAGVLAMANAGPNTNGSQFFITVAPAAHLNGHYNIFGHVISGMDVAQKIVSVERDAQDKPVKPVTIIRLTVHTRAPAKK